MEKKQCMTCKSKLLTFSDTPYCGKCIKVVCCMSNEKFYCKHIGYYTNRCNKLFGCVEIDGKKICLNHFKMKQNTCKLCDIKRDNENYHDDHMWYCDNHRPKYNKKKMTTWLCLQDKLNGDLINKIYDKLNGDLINNTNKYHKDFNRPNNLSKLCY